MAHKIIVFALLFLTTSMVIPQSSKNMNDSSTRLHSLFREDWDYGLREFPEGATLIGDHRYDDRLTDLSPEAIERRKQHDRDMLGLIKLIDRSKLAGEDIISYDLFLRDKELAVEGQRFPLELMPISQMDGPQIGFAQLADSSPFHNAKDYQNYLARLDAFSKYIDQVIALMKTGIDKHWVQVGIPLRSIPEQIEGQIVDDPTKSPLYKPFTEFPNDLAAADKKRFADGGRKAIAESIMPTLKKLDSFIRDTYLPACRKEIGASSLPEGDAYYAYSAKLLTTTNLSPKEIHDIGLKEVARIRKEMESIIERVGFKGSFQDFLTFLRTDPRFYYTKPEDLVSGYRDFCKRVDGKLPELFAELPRNSYGVREIAAYEAPAQTTAYYQPGAPDGSRAGTYWVNTYKLETRPKYEMEALSLHESVPGHHLQISQAQELKGLPDFRRNGGYTAYVEGWALYAESLGTDMGFYTDPYSKFGQLTYEMWRACRLVVDTGMHQFGWSRQRAIDFMKENTAKTENDITVEIDRYIVWPGQALAYKLGQLKITSLKMKAKAELGSRFDIRRFHNAVLDEGPLPLDVLEQRIDIWIAQQKKGNQ